MSCLWWQLFKNVAERGRWSEMVMEAHAMYRESNTDGSLLLYTLLAELGYEVAQSNVAYMLDKRAFSCLLFTVDHTYSCHVSTVASWCGAMGEKIDTFKFPTFSLSKIFSSKSTKELADILILGDFGGKVEKLKI